MNETTNASILQLIKFLGPLAMAPMVACSPILSENTTTSTPASHEGRAANVNIINDEAISESEAAVAARSYLVSGETAPSGLGAYGYLLFSKKPDSSSRQRYLAAASAYWSLPDVSSVSRYTVKSSIMPTYWMVTEESNLKNEDRDLSADKMIDFYDYARAATKLSKINKAGCKGPVLAAWSPSDEDAKVLVFDLSNFSEHDMGRAIDLWKKQISRDHTQWNEGVNYIRAREEIRNLLLANAESIISLFQIRN